MNKQYFDLKTVEDIMQTMITAAGGELVPDENQPAEPGQPVNYHREGGAVAMVSNLVGGLYATQPASSVEYLADLGSRLGLAKPAYAQGFGWQAFSPVLDLWKLFRNIAYLFFVIIFVVIGFMIMFRAKINPQTVISIQNALPRIIVTLLLITFSYAIAGLVIDLGQLATRLIGNLLCSQNFIAQGPFNPATRSFCDRTQLNNLLSNENIFSLVNPIRDPAEIVKAIETIPLGVTAALPNWLADITLYAVFWIAGFFIMFKIFFALIGPYVNIVLSIILAPIQLLLGAFPGMNSLGSWLKGVIANVLVFPVTFALLAIAAIIKDGDLSSKGADWGVATGDYTPLWTPSTIGTWAGAIPHLISFGILFIIPHVAKITASMAQGKGMPTETGEAVREELRGAVGRLPGLKTIVRI